MLNSHAVGRALLVPFDFNNLLEKILNNFDKFQNETNKFIFQELDDKNFNLKRSECLFELTL